MKNPRFWEIDLARGLAIIGMVIYHLLVDLYLLGQLHLNPFIYPTLLLARVTAVTFLFLVGFSFSLSLEKNNPINHETIYQHTLERAFRVFLSSLTVTLATYFISPNFTVRFGILNLISLSLLLLLVFSLVTKRILLIPISLLLVILGFNLRLDHSQFNTFDYYPLLPWFGFVLLGFALATNYPKKRKNFPQPSHPSLQLFSFLGRHSLLIYLLHQPILFGLLLLFKI